MSATVMFVENKKENNYRIGINFQPKKMYTTFV